jgi:3-isopropylmalate/(R)-2-methylmalate dehydratase small subunit
MNPFRQHCGRVVPLWRDDIDTDQIVPKQFLTATSRAGFGRTLFHSWRWRPDGSPDETFPLNQLQYAHASILAAGRNFGCGSSREHAAWALVDAGFRAVIASSFADIFRGNAVANGLLPVSLPEDTVATIIERAARTPRYALTIDLVRQRVTDEERLDVRFDLEPGPRDRLLNGLDAITMTLMRAEAIGAFERRRDARS